LRIFNTKPCKPLDEPPWALNTDADSCHIIRISSAEQRRFVKKPHFSWGFWHSSTGIPVWTRLFPMYRFNSHSALSLNLLPLSNACSRWASNLTKWASPLLESPKLFLQGERLP
jgi:hypothetical protein